MHKRMEKEAAGMHGCSSLKGCRQDSESNFGNAHEGDSWIAYGTGRRGTLHWHWWAMHAEYTLGKRGLPHIDTINQIERFDGRGCRRGKQWWTRKTKNKWYKAITMSNITTACYGRSREEEDTTWYLHEASPWGCTPNFFGYQVHPTWPLDEAYVKTILFLQCTHWRSFTNLTSNNFYAAYLLDHVKQENNKFPIKIHVKINGSKKRWQLANPDIEMDDNRIVQTQTRTRTGTIKNSRVQ